MNLALFYDTETTGLPLFRDPSDDPRQPHLVQLAARLVDLDTRKVASEIDLTIRPDGWEIPEEVAEIHGITTEIASDTGVSESIAMGVLMNMWENAGVRIGHNESFDARIVRIALMREVSREMADTWKDSPALCTARMSSPLVRLEATEAMRRAGRGKQNKTPKLTEAYQWFFGREMEDAHTAMGDTRACQEVYFGILDLQAKQAEAKDVFAA